MKLKLLLFAFSLFVVLSLSSQNVSAVSCNQDSDCSGCQICRYTGFLGLGGRQCVPLPNEADKAAFPHVWTDPCEEIYKQFCYQGTGSSSVDVWAGQQSCPYTYSYKSCQGSEKLVQTCSGSTPKCYESGNSAKCVECLSNVDCTLPKTCKLDEHRCVSPLPTCSSPSSYSNSNNCQSADCYWCAPPAYSGYCEASSDKCTSPCTYTGNPTKDDAACPDTCETGGCNLRINVCTTGGTCGYSMTSKFCGAGMSCDKAVECYQSTGACGASGGSI